MGVGLGEIRGPDASRFHGQLAVVLTMYATAQPATRYGDDRFVIAGTLACGASERVRTALGVDDFHASEVPGVQGQMEMFAAAFRCHEGCSGGAGD
jgi:hypothetical protein